MRNLDASWSQGPQVARCRSHHPIYTFSKLVDKLPQVNRVGLRFLLYEIQPFGQLICRRMIDFGQSTDFGQSSLRSGPIGQSSNVLVPVRHSSFVAPFAKFGHRFFVRRSHAVGVHRRFIIPYGDGPECQAFCLPHSCATIAIRSLGLLKRPYSGPEKGRRKA